MVLPLYIITNKITAGYDFLFGENQVFYKIMALYVLDQNGTC